MTEETITNEVQQEQPVVSVEEFNQLKEQLAVALEGVEKLKAKNSELISEKRSVQAKLAEAGDTESLSSIRAEYEQAKEELNAQLAQRDEMLNVRTQQLHSMMTTDVLKAELSAAGVKEGLLDGAMAVLANRVSVVEADGSMRAVFDETVSITEGVKEWAETAGKDYLASTSQGAGFPKSDTITGNSPSTNNFFNPTNI